MARVEARHGTKEWKIDLGDDHDDYYAVPDSMLVKIQHDLNVIGVVDSYLRQRRHEGLLTSRRLRPGGQPINW